MQKSLHNIYYRKLVFHQKIKLILTIEISNIFDSKFIFKLPRIILSVVVMSEVLYLLLGFFSDKFNYNESWKFIYLFIIVIISLISYFLISNFTGAFKLKDIKLKN